LDSVEKERVAKLDARTYPYPTLSTPIEIQGFIGTDEITLSKKFEKLRHGLLNVGPIRALRLSPKNLRFWDATSIPKMTLFCDNALLSHHHTCGLHGGVGVVDCGSRQAYKVTVVMAPCERC
jgi:hypothetical protein